MTYAKLLLENFIDNHNSSYYFTTHIKGQLYGIYAVTDKHLEFSR